MATKLKKSRPGAAFVLFALSLTIVIAAVAGGLYLWAAGAVALDYKETPRYQQAVNRIRTLMQLPKTDRMETQGLRCAMI